MRRLISLALLIAAAALTTSIAAGQLAIDTTSLPAAVTGQPYSPVPLQSSGDPGPIGWSCPNNICGTAGFVTGPGPVGGPPTVGLFCYGSANPGETPTCSGTGVSAPVGSYTITIQATAPSEQTVTKQFTLTVVNPLQIPNTPPPNAGVGQVYSYQIPVNGGTGQFKWSQTSGTLPPGIGLDAFKGVLAGTPGLSGAYTFTLQVQDQVTQFTASQTFTINVFGPLTILTTTLPDAILGQAYTPLQLQATGSPSLVWSFQTGTTLPGFSLSPSGLLTGAGVQLGRAAFGVQVTNPSVTGVTAIQSLTLVTTLGPLGIKESVLPAAVQNVPYQTTLTPLGGVPPYNWSLDAPNPQGLTINASTGVISGTPTKTGGLALPVTLRDSIGRAFSISYTLSVGTPLSISTTSLPAASIGQPYSPITLQSSGDPGPIVWSCVPSNTCGPFGFVAGSGPAGTPATAGIFCYGSISLGQPPTCSGNNVITPAGVYTITIQASSLSTQQTVSQQYAFAVVNTLQIPNTPPPNASVGQTYSYQIPVNGGTGQFKWSQTGGTLPPGIGLDSSKGVLTGTAPGVNFAYTFTLQVLDLVTQATASQTFTLNVVGGLAILTTTLPDAIVGQPYDPVQLQATGSSSLVWSIQTGTVLPGFSLSPSGLLTGTGLQTGRTTFGVQVTTPEGLTATQSLTLTTTLGPLSIKETVLPTATQNVAYQFNLTPQGGIPPYNWSFDVPNPQGLTIGATTGVISGTPTKAGVFTLPVTLKDSIGRAFSISYALNVGTSVSISTTSLVSGPPGLPYADTLTAVGGVLTYQWSVVAGSLPPGLTLTTKNSTGAISGTPTTQGVFQFTVQVLDFAGGTDKKAFTITIGPVLAITTLSLPDGLLGGVPYSQTLTAANGTPNADGTYAWSIASGTLPPGLQLNGTTGVISGTPTTAGTFTFDVQVTDAAKGVAHRNLTIKVPLLITTGDLAGAVLSAFSQTLTATGGTPPYAWTIASGALPGGLQLNSATGVISGTPSPFGTSHVTFTATDALGLTGSKIINIIIIAPSTPIFSIGVGSTTQPAVSLTTSAPYPLEITGFLTLTFAASPSGADGGESRFSDGSRQLFFVVRPNTTQGLFTTVSNGNPAILLGTVAGTITLTTSMSAGGQDITGTPAPTKTIVIDPAVPVINSVVLQQVTGGLNVVVTGYSNTREVSSGSFTFSVSSGNTLSQSQITVQLSSAYATWFNSTASNATGGQFKLTVPFSVTQGAAAAVTKVGVSLTNSKGASPTVSSP